MFAIFLKGIFTCYLEIIYDAVSLFYKQCRISFVQLLAANCFNQKTLLSLIQINFITLIYHNALFHKCQLSLSKCHFALNARRKQTKNLLFHKALYRKQGPQFIIFHQIIILKRHSSNIFSRTMIVDIVFLCL